MADEARSQRAIAHMQARARQPPSRNHQPCPGAAPLHVYLQFEQPAWGPQTDLGAHVDGTRFLHVGTSQTHGGRLRAAGGPQCAWYGFTESPFSSEF